MLTHSSGLWGSLVQVTDSVCVRCRQMVSQAAMRGQRVVESECRCWNPALWVLVSLLGSLVLVALSVLMRLGECVCVWGGGTMLDLSKHYRSTAQGQVMDYSSSTSGIQNTMRY